MLIGWDNKVDTASLSASSEIATLPASNVQEPHLSLKWHMAAGVKSGYVVIDAGSSVSCSVLAVLGTNLTSAATMQLRASDADSGAVSSLLYDSGSISAGVDDNYGAIYKSWTAQAARYWRLDLADASLPDNIQVGRIFLGPAWTPTINMQLDPGFDSVDPSRIDKSYGGQAWADVRPQYRCLEFSLDLRTEAEIFGNAYALARAAGVVSDVLVIPDISGSYLSQQAIWGLMSSSTPIRQPKTNSYTKKFKIEERL